MVGYFGVLGQKSLINLHHRSFYPPHKVQLNKVSIFWLVDIFITFLISDFDLRSNSIFYPSLLKVVRLASDLVKQLLGCNFVQFRC